MQDLLPDADDEAGSGEPDHPSFQSHEIIIV
jgi:hypothetical protein